ncbi:MAG: YeiH family putative sulfate export transporter [Oceanospirillaceae bacterium]|nr:YeiH family putative sulfate export transporter [Oceanospirillaceae bacterium]MBL33627.1 YeiH family putative sulfate export transporter [Oceanospirillaceae bacterium]|tara:strand:+ start:246 stop:1505 length:1260 start_codon:yes stop_codon:yes gene_type:complete
MDTGTITRAAGSAGDMENRLTEHTAASGFAGSGFADSGFADSGFKSSGFKRSDTGLTGAVLMLLLIATVSSVAAELAGVRWLSQWGLGALPISIVLGMALVAIPAVGRLRMDSGAQRIQSWVQKYLLQAGIVLFGFRLSVTDLTAVGWPGLLMDSLTIVVILCAGMLIGGRLLKLPMALVVFVSVGSAVCGAAAILAAAPVLGRYLHDGENEQQQTQAIGLAVAMVAVFGTLSVILYPQLRIMFGLNDYVSGIYIGSTIHEVAQAVAASDALGSATQHNAVIVKLLRVMLLAPVLIVLALLLQRGGRDNGSQSSSNQGAKMQHKIRVPGFVLLFLAAVLLNTLLQLYLPATLLAQLRDLCHGASGLFLALAMTALGLNIHWAFVRRAGFRPILLAGLLWLLLILGGGFLLMQLQAAALI